MSRHKTAYAISKSAENNYMKTQISSPTGIGDLVEVLRDELHAHHKLLELELKKREAIIARDGESLRSSATCQADELAKIEVLESRRELIVRHIAPESENMKLSEMISLEKISPPDKQELGRYAVALKSALTELKKISESNTQMLIDSREMFTNLLQSFANSARSGQIQGTRPVFIDANC